MGRQKQAIATFKQAMNIESQFPIDRKISNPIPFYLEATHFAELLYQVGRVEEFDGKFPEAAETYLDICEFGIEFQQKRGKPLSRRRNSDGVYWRRAAWRTARPMRPENCLAH